jgi:hypothetical protein
MRDRTAELSRAAVRMRRHRERRRQGIISVLIELSETDRDALVSRGVLRSDMRNNQSSIRVAIYEMLERAADQKPPS